MKTLGVVGNHIKDKDSKYKAKYKAKELAKCKLRKFDDEEIVRLFVGDKGQLSVQVKGQKHIFDYYNPPILIADGTKNEEEDNFKEDLEECLKTLIKQTLQTINT